MRTPRRPRERAPVFAKPMAANRARPKPPARPPRAAHAPARTTPAIDIGALGDMVGYVLRRAQLTVFDDMARTVAPFGLRIVEFSVLVVLDASPGQTQSAIAAALGIQRANFVALFNTLEARGLAERRSSLADRRSYALHLTAVGAELLARARVAHLAHEARQIDRLGPDNVATLLALLRRLAKD